MFSITEAQRAQFEDVIVAAANVFVAKPEKHVGKTDSMEWGLARDRKNDPKINARHLLNGLGKSSWLFEPDKIEVSLVMNIFRCSDPSCRS